MIRPKTAAVVAAALTAASLAAIDASGSATPAAGQTLTFTAKPQGGSNLDTGRKGVTPGDQFFEHGALSGSASGSYSLSGQLVSGDARHGREHAMLTLYLPGGTLEAVGGHGLGSRFTMPLAGGTGSYADARGTLAVVPGKGETEALTATLAG